ncbi:3'-5' ssDNA/RNA exonuclease TatD-like [Gigantopelta aegis]|uniref:3'-5' ssDNA/RNA exonuclease TatD-like n=1 Tax=Gigantopelta aegis TaxID=1735272 RepID=UPI001B887BD8|nr:3'-5' ssDNA/RNA exonuclease TatD-like [Gigantopelta aegis]
MVGPSEVDVPAIEQMARFLGEPSQQFTLHPVLSMSALIHWRALLHAVALLSLEDRRWFLGWSAQGLDIPRNKCIPAGAEISHDDAPGRLVITGSGESPSVEGDTRVVSVGAEPGESWAASSGQLVEGRGRLQGVDAHFHPKSCARVMKLGTDPSLEKVVRYNYPHRIPCPVIDVIGGVSVYIEPGHFPPTVECYPAWKVVVGIHPRFATTVQDADRGWVEKMANKKGVAVFIGLDFSADVGTWRAQELLMKALLEASKPSTPVVASFVGGNWSRGSLAAGILLLQERCPPTQKIHLTSFDGGCQAVKDACRLFPEAYFGVSGKVFAMDGEQRQAMALITVDRLLLETNAPHVGLRGQGPSGPSYLGEVAAEVARVRNTSLEAVLQSTVSNARRLYGLVNQ